MKRNQRRSAWFAIALGAAGTASPLSCTDFSERVAPGIDCTVGSAYEIHPGIGEFEEEMKTSWYQVPDGTGAVDCDHPLAGKDITEDVPVEALGGAGNVPAEGGAGGESAICVPPQTVAVPSGMCEGPRYSQALYNFDVIPEGTRCRSTKALHLTASHNNDWGGFFGNYVIAQAPIDVSEWEGLALWARAEQGTQRSVTIALDDKYTANVPCLESFCIEEEQQGTTQVTNTSGVSQSSGQIAGWVPSENACGNSYEYHLTVTNDWALYLIPFEDFHQQPLPNRRIEGIDRESLRGVRIQMPKESVLDLWIDDFGFYRKPGQLGIGGDSTDP